MSVGAEESALAGEARRALIGQVHRLGGLMTRWVRGRSERCCRSAINAVFVAHEGFEGAELLDGSFGSGEDG